MATASKGPAPQPLTLNDHALALIRALPEPLPAVCLEICQRQGMQPWHLVLGHMIKADQQSELHAPLLMPEWTSTSVTPESISERRCDACKQVMVKQRPGALFCCNYCGSGRWHKERTHHPKCEFFTLPKTHLAQSLVAPRTVSPVPPEDPEARRVYEEQAYERHVRESEMAEAQAPGLPPTPGGEVLQVKTNVNDWTKG